MLSVAWKQAESPNKENDFPNLTHPHNSTLFMVHDRGSAHYLIVSSIKYLVTSINQSFKITTYYFV